MDDNTSIQFRLRLAQINGIKMNEEQIDEVVVPPPAPQAVKSSGLMPKEPAAEDHRVQTLKTYHTAMANYSHLSPVAAHKNALNDTIDKHGSENARQHLRHHYRQMKLHFGDNDHI